MLSWEVQSVLRKGGHLEGGMERDSSRISLTWEGIGFNLGLSTLSCFVAWCKKLLALTRFS